MCLSYFEAFWENSFFSKKEKKFTKYGIVKQKARNNLSTTDLLSEKHGKFQKRKFEKKFQT